LSVEVRKLSEVKFKPFRTVGTLTLGEVDGKAAISALGLEEVWVMPVVWILLPLIVWIIEAAIWWWASSDLKFSDISKIIGLLSPLLGVAAEALIK